jgi:hypothetical protein
VESLFCHNLATQDPYAGLYLTDVTFCREGNPNFRASPGNPAKKLLNFNKYHKLARIVQGRQLKIPMGILSDLFFLRYATFPGSLQSEGNP